ncbi:hypothetical protein A3C23_02015 [Candidatus Roizmanbacteria bacterium RIFCSPHIGHO2_02_FULL_37_13b]|uniref:EamA domain-containing protein n=1 Tax=Candidatus Roizmanbacteria bacterium RIFCSPLOWO2_02_FULL_36_11 TaxID=1802071 RepID=A0A1F7JBT5_9BACT|nr:MAG: hypothetical protein A3C23_02015 [Candidatus Roizmanbacteria bacterium RIFCSPHIGHO2_02_FULL_37_13b]OGK53025.1 MAG: hypothetical protein A3H78_02335 [Candidatus Roizmanbacteria bacterium RIFCSPLOWO2_02_FULL_36_11]
MSNQLKKGIGLALMTMVISGFSNYVNKIAVMKIDPVLHTTIKNSLVFIMIGGFYMLFNRRHSISKLTRADKLRLILIGIIGGGVPFYLFFTALVNVSAINAALIHKSLIFWVILLAIPYLKERINIFHIIGVVLLFGSNFLIGGFSGFKFSLPELMILSATILWAIESIVAKRTLKHVDPTVMVAARMGIGALILLLITVLTGKLSVAPSLSLNQWALTIMTSFLLFGYVMTWYRALKYAPVITVASILVGATLITNILTAIIDTKNLALYNWQPSIIVISGLLFILLGTFRSNIATNKKLQQ